MNKVYTNLEVRIHLLFSMSVFVHELNDPFPFSFLSLGDHPEAIPPKFILSVDTCVRGSRAQVRCCLISSSLFISPQHLFISFRVHAHVASALLNFCEGVKRDTLLLYLNPIVERLLKLLNPMGGPALVRYYTQEQVITTLTVVANVSEVTVPKVSKGPLIGQGVFE